MLNSIKNKKISEPIYGLFEFSIDDANENQDLMTMKHR